MGILDSVLGSGGKKPKGDIVGSVISMRQQGAPDAVIAQQLQMQGVPLPQIQDAMSQADIKMRVSGGPGGQSQQQMIGPPLGPISPPDIGPPQISPPDMGPPQIGLPQIGIGGPDIGQQQIIGGVPDIGMQGSQPIGPSPEELIERIIDEKWHTMQEKFDRFEESKSELLRQLQDLRDNLNDLRVKYAQLQEDSVVKIEEYNKELEGVGSQIKAMQRVMQNMIPVFAENVRQLNDIVVEMKGTDNSPAQPPAGTRPPSYQQQQGNIRQTINAPENVRVKIEATPFSAGVLPGPIKKPAPSGVGDSEEPLFR